MPESNSLISLENQVFFLAVFLEFLDYPNST